MNTVHEVEWKFEPLDETARIPNLGEVGMTLGPPVVIELHATYYDTADLRLLAHKLTLRHRTGGADAGWHLKLPAGGDARTEVQIDADANGGVPAELLALVRSRARRASITPVATLATRRTERAVCLADGTHVAAMVDDHVHAVRAADGTVSDWHELEVELVELVEPAGDATVDVLSIVATVLGTVGWQRSTSSSKIGKVLGPLPDAPAPPHRAAPRCVLDHLAAQIEAIAVADPLVRNGDAEAVHDMRVASRRLRSALGTFRPLLDETQTGPLRIELQTLGRVLGALRDDDVLHARLTDAVHALPPELVLGTVGATIDLEMHDRHRRHAARVGEHLDSVGYLALLDALAELVTDPPWNTAEPIRRRDLRRRVEHDVGRVDDLAAFGPAMDDGRLHVWRKAAKRARYAAEAIVALEGKPAERLASRFAALQEALGEHQDSIGARVTLRQLGAAARGRAQNGFTFGVLYEAEAQRGDRAVRRAWKASAATTRGRGWLHG